MKKLAALLLTFSLTLVFIPAFTASGAQPPKPVVMSATGNIYKDGGISIVFNAVDVFITPSEDTVYYYRIGNSPLKLSIYYQGDNNKPVGSFFSGTQVRGSRVASVGGAGVDKITGTRLDPGSGYKITVPFASGTKSVLRVIAYTNGEASEVFAHTFSEPFFDSERQSDGNLITTVATDPSLELGIIVFTGVYRKDSGVLVTAHSTPFVSGATFSVDLSGYPLNEYKYKVFCWQDNYVPLFEAISFE
jgi:hypothetical protein